MAMVVTIMMILMIMRRRKATEKEKREVLRFLMMIDVNENAGERVRGRQP